MTFMPKALARWATSVPMRPKPMMPRVLSASSTPVHCLRSHRPAFSAALATGMLRAWASSMAMVCSAVESVLDCGAFTTITPRSVAASVSTLSRPMPARPTTTRSVPASSTSRVTVVAERMMRAWAPLTSSSSSSGDFLSWMSTSWPASRSFWSPLSAISSVTRMRAIAPSLAGWPGRARTTVTLGPVKIRLVLADDHYLIREGVGRCSSPPRTTSSWSPPARTSTRCWRPSTSTTPTWWSPTSGCRPPAPTRGCALASTLRRDPSRHRRRGPQPVRRTRLRARPARRGLRGAGLPAEGAGVRRRRAGRTPSGRWPHGDSAIDPKVVEALVQARGAAADSPLRFLTPRELEVLAEIATGKNNAAIAADPGAQRTGGREAHQLDLLEAAASPRRPAIHRRVKAVLLFLGEQAERRTDPRGVVEAPPRAPPVGILARSSS